LLEDLKRQRDGIVAMREMFDRRERMSGDQVPQLEKRITTAEKKIEVIKARPDPPSLNGSGGSGSGGSGSGGSGSRPDLSRSPERGREPRPRGSSRPPDVRSNEGSRNSKKSPPDRRSSRDKTRDDSRDRSNEGSRNSKNASDRRSSRDMTRDDRRDDRRDRAYPDKPRYRDDPQDRRSRSSRRGSDYDYRSTSRSISRDNRDNRDRSSSRSYLDREDRLRYDRSVSRGRRYDDDDDGYRSTYSRSRSGSRIRDLMDRSRSPSNRDFYLMERKAALDMLRPENEIDSLLKRVEDMSLKTAQKSQERQLLFVAVAFFIGFIFAQGIIY